MPATVVYQGKITPEFPEVTTKDSLFGLIGSDGGTIMMEKASAVVIIRLLNFFNIGLTTFYSSI